VLFASEEGLVVDGTRPEIGTAYDEIFTVDDSLFN
jgi:hypothetical protein